MDILNVTRDYAQCISSGTITEPTGGTWISAAALYLGATQPVNGSWLQALCLALGITTPVNGSWVIALANYYGITQPLNGSWWYAIADSACGGGIIPISANFTASTTTPTTGGTVNFTDTSTGTPTSWSWTFAGGTPATSTLQNPSIVYNTVGTFDVSLTASKVGSTDTETKLNYIVVSAPTPPPFIWDLDTRFWEAETRVWATTPPFDPDAQAFLTATGISDPTQGSAVNQLVLDLKAAAIWTKMTAVYPIVGGTATTHKYNLVDPQDTDAAYRIDFNGTFTHSANGAAGGGNSSDWADTHWIPANQSFANGVHWSANVYSGQTSGGQYNMGSAGTGDWALINGFTSQTDYWQAGTGGYLTNVGDSPSDFIAGTANGTNIRALYDDGVQVASSTNGSINTSVTISTYLWAVNVFNSAASNSNDTMNFFTIGEYLNSTEMAALYGAITTFNTTLGR